MSEALKFNTFEANKKQRRRENLFAQQNSNLNFIDVSTLDYY